MLIDTGVMTADLRRVADLARDAEAFGYDGLWTAEAGHDPYLPCATAATATERVTIGTNIAVAFPRSPLVHAQIAWDLQAASRGRFVLGLGTQVKGHNERRYSTPWTAPGPRLREMILLLRHIWDVWQNGTRPGFEGTYYRFSLMTPFFSPGPHRVAARADLHRRGESLHVPAGRRAVRRHPRPPVPLGEVPARDAACRTWSRASRRRAAPAQDLTLATTAFVVTGKTRDDDRARQGPRADADRLLRLHPHLLAACSRRTAGARPASA